MSLELQHKTVLVTGASSGIGSSFAKRCASEGAKVLVTARREEKLEELKEEILRECGVNITVIVQDLATTGSAEALFEETQSRGYEVDVLANFAGFGYIGYFLEQESANIDSMLTLQVHNGTKLAQLYGNDMAQRKSGTVLQVASTAAFQAVPYFSVYAAAKVYLLNLSLGLADELKEHGVAVHCLCPGATRTEFQTVANASKDEKPIGGWRSAEQVVDYTMKRLGSKKVILVPGIRNKLAAALNNFMPRQMSAAIAGGLYKPVAK